MNRKLKFILLIIISFSCIRNQGESWQPHNHKTPKIYKRK